MKSIVLRASVVTAAVATMAACAGSTIRSGVGDRQFERPPFAAGKAVTTASADVAHLAVAYQRGATDAAIFDPDAAKGTELATFVSELNAYLDQRGLSTRLTQTDEPSRRPDVQFGCITDASGDCDPAGGESGSPSYRMRLAVARPTNAWTTWLASSLSSGGKAAALVITVEIGDYWPRQKDLRGRKEVELGTGYSVSMPWLTATDRTMRVVQLTGALIGSDGQAIRIGAEGLLAKRTGMLAGSLGAQAQISDDDIRTLRQLRRDDLPGNPLVWQAALDNLVSQLLGVPVPPRA